MRFTLMLPLWMLAGIGRPKKSYGECCLNNSDSAGARFTLRKEMAMSCTPSMTTLLE